MAIIALGAEVVQQLLTTPPEGLANLVTMLVVCYSLGRYARRPRGYAGILLIAAVAFGVGQDLADNTFVLLVLGRRLVRGAGGRGTDRRSRRTGAAPPRRHPRGRRGGAAADRARAARRGRPPGVDDGRAERARRRRCSERDPARAREAIVAVESAGREALVELRSVLGLMHDVDRASLAPVDTELSRLGEVIDEARAGGLPVTFETTGTARAVPPAVALAAFRIVQESLTNVVRHAASAPTTGSPPLPPRRRRGHRRERRARPGRRAAWSWPGRHGRAGDLPRRHPDDRTTHRTWRLPCLRDAADTRGRPVTRVVVADDQEMVRDGLAAILDTEPDLEVVGHSRRRRGGRRGRATGAARTWS